MKYCVARRIRGLATILTGTLELTARTEARVDNFLIGRAGYYMLQRARLI